MSKQYRSSLEEQNRLDKLALCSSILSMNGSTSDTSSISWKDDSCEVSVHDEFFSTLLTFGTLGQYIEVNK